MYTGLSAIWQISKPELGETSELRVSLPQWIGLQMLGSQKDFLMEDLDRNPLCTPGCLLYGKLAT